MPDYYSDDPTQFDARSNQSAQNLNQAADAFDSASSRLSQSVSALSTNLLGQIQQVQSGQLAQAVAPGMNPFAQMGALAAASYGRGMNPYAPQMAMAQDMYQRQAQMSLAGMGAAGIMTPFGDPTINPFMTPTQPMYALPTQFLQAYGSPGQPGDPARSRFFFGTGAGSAASLAHQAIATQFFGGFGNDNLEDRVFRYAERNQQYGAENIARLTRDVSGNLASIGGGILGGMALGQLALPIPGVGALAGGVLGGMAGFAVGDAPFGMVDRMARPYRQTAMDMRDYTAPYMRGQRLGGGMSFRETLGLQRDLEKQISRDNFFNAQDYQQLIGMAGETGLFSMTSNKDQALKAVERLGDSVKTLFQLGVKSREQLDVIATSFNQLGINPSSDPHRMANVFTTLAAQAQSAGMSTTQIMQASAPAAQMAMAQGLGPLAGMQMSATNLGFGGGFFRSGMASGFDQAYFGGAQGFGQTLTRANMAMLRTGIGQTMMAGLFAPGSNLMGTLMGQGGSMTPEALIGAVGGHAMDPMGFMGMQAEMPELTQNLGNFLQPAMLDNAMQTYRQLTGDHGQIDLRKFRGFLMAAYGLDEQAALAMTKQIGAMPQIAADARRSIGDQRSILRMEQLRRPTLARQIEKFKERTVDAFATEADVKLHEFGLGVLDTTAQAATGLAGAVGLNDFLRPYGMEFRGGSTWEEFTTGRRVADLGSQSSLLDPVRSLQDAQQADKLLQNLGMSREMVGLSPSQRAGYIQDKQIADRLRAGGPGMESVVRRTLEAAGIQGGDASRFLDSFETRRFTPDQMDALSKRSDLVRRMLDRTTALSPSGGGASHEQMRDIVAQAVGQRYDEDQVANVNVIKGLANYYNPDSDAANRNLKDIAITQLTDAGTREALFKGLSPNDDPLKQRDDFMQRVAQMDPELKGKSLMEIRDNPMLAAKLAQKSAALADTHAAAMSAWRSSIVKNDAIGGALIASAVGTPLAAPVGAAMGAAFGVVHGMVAQGVEHLVNREGQVADQLASTFRGMNDNPGGRELGVEALHKAMEATADNITGAMGYFGQGWTAGSGGSKVREALKAEGQKGLVNARVLSMSSVSNLIRSAGSIAAAKQALIAQGMSPETADATLKQAGATDTNLSASELAANIDSDQQSRLDRAVRDGLMTKDEAAKVSEAAMALRNSGADGAKVTKLLDDQVNNLNAGLAYSRKHLDAGQRDALEDAFRGHFGTAGARDLVSRLQANDMGAVQQAAGLAFTDKAQAAAVQQIAQFVGASGGGRANAQKIKDALEKAGVGKFSDEELAGMDTKGLGAALRQTIVDRLAPGSGGEQPGMRYGKGLSGTAADSERAAETQLKLLSKMEALAGQFDATRVKQTQEAVDKMTSAVGGENSAFVKALNNFTKALSEKNTLTGSIKVDLVRNKGEGTYKMQVPGQT
jgi:hypothetical protein